MERGGGGLGVHVYLQDILELIAYVDVLVVIIDLRVMGDQSILRANVDGVVDLPVDVPHLSGRVEQTLKREQVSL